MKKTIFLLGFIAISAASFSQTKTVVKKNIEKTQEISLNKKKETKSVKIVQRVTGEGVSIEDQIASFEKKMATYTDTQIIKEYSDKIASLKGIKK